MYLQRLERVQFLPLSIEEAWNFFSSPENLDVITPEDLSFEIKSDLPEKMYAGMIIEYRLKLFGFVPQNWVTEITQVEEHRFFIDEQKFGPYSFWHHQHWFESVEGGTEMRDILHYRLPFGVLGKMVHTLFIKQQVENIFSHRKKVLNQLFRQLHPA